MSLRGKLTTALELPQEMLGGPDTVVRGREEVTVSHCRRILAYSTAEISLLLKGVTLCIVGEKLTMVRYLNGNVTVRGQVDSLSFASPERGGDAR